MTGVVGRMFRSGAAYANDRQRAMSLISKSKAHHIARGGAPQNATDRLHLCEKELGRELRRKEEGETFVRQGEQYGIAADEANAAAVRESKKSNPDKDLIGEHTKRATVYRTKQSLNHSWGRLLVLSSNAAIRALRAEISTLSAAVAMMKSIMAVVLAPIRKTVRVRSSRQRRTATSTTSAATESPPGTPETPSDDDPDGWRSTPSFATSRHKAAGGAR